MPVPATLHPILGALLVLSSFAVAILGWRHRLNPSPGSGALHARWGKVFVAGLGLGWLLGLAGVATAQLPGVGPGLSGHFVNGTYLLAGYGLSAALMLRWQRH